MSCYHVFHRIVTREAFEICENCLDQDKHNPDFDPAAATRSNLKHSQHSQATQGQSASASVVPNPEYRGDDTNSPILSHGPTMMLKQMHAEAMKCLAVVIKHDLISEVTSTKSQVRMRCMCSLMNVPNLVMLSNQFMLLQRGAAE